MIKTNHLLDDSDLCMTVKTPRRTRLRALVGRRDYWEHYASIIASHLAELEEEKRKLIKKKLFIYINLVMLIMEFDVL